MHRGTVDNTPDVLHFANSLEAAVIEVVEAGQMTKDLAVLIHPDQPYLTTEPFLEAVDFALGKRLSLSLKSR
jgi:isocitrate dehydrogenase